jgi:transcriptional regulator with XRE-family HTH domain
MMLIAYNTIMYRFRRRWTQQQLAEMCDWKVEKIIRLERAQGDISLDHIDKLAYALNVYTDDLIEERNFDEVNKHNRFNPYLYRSASLRN